MKEFFTKDLLDFINENSKSNVYQLRLKGGLSEEQMDFVTRQIYGRQKAKKKLPSWHQNELIAYPKRVSVEQSSSEALAKFKAKLIGSGEKFVDLNGGFGVDAFYIGQNFAEAVYVERDKQLSEIVSHNYNVLNSDIKVLNIDFKDFIDNNKSLYDVVYLDPARRNETKGKVFRMEDSEPDMVHWAPILLKHSQKVVIKFSPMLDITDAIAKIPAVSDVHVISYRNEVKEILVFLSTSATKEPKIHSTDIKNQELAYETFQSTNTVQSIEITDRVEDYVYEPNKSILKANAQNDLANHFNLKKLHPNTHLYTSNQLHPSFQGRIFSLSDQIKVNKKEFQSHLPNKRANVITRNFPLSPRQLVKKLHIIEGGDLYVLACTLSDDAKALLICHRVK